MLQGLKNKVLPGMLMVVIMGLVFASCNNASETEETTTPPVMETPAPEMKTIPDTLPTIDTSARSRPEPRKT